MRQKLSQEDAGRAATGWSSEAQSLRALCGSQDQTDEEAAAFLRLALTSEEARAYLKKRTEGGKSE